LVSFGGTSLVVSMAAMGILTSIARHAKPLPKRASVRPKVDGARIAKARAAVSGFFESGRGVTRPVRTASNAGRSPGVQGAHRAKR